MSVYPEARYAEWTRTVDPASEPITLAEAKLHGRYSQDPEDSLFVSYIKAAREAAEDYLGRGLFTQTWQLSLGCFYDSMSLPMAAPLQSVTQIQYYDINGTLQALSTSLYDVDTTARPGKVVRAANQSWPSLQADKQLGRVLITYVVGFTSTDLIPERIKQGIRLYVGYMMSDREGFEDSEKSMKAIHACWTDRVRWIPPTSDLYPWYMPDARWTA